MQDGMHPIFWGTFLAQSGRSRAHTHMHTQVLKNRTESKPQDPQTSQCKSARQFFDLSVYLQEEPVLFLWKRSQKHVINRGPLSPFLILRFSSFLVEFLLNRPQRNASKLTSRGLQICGKRRKITKKTVQNAPKIRPGRPSGQTRAPSSSSRSYKKLTC